MNLDEIKQNKSIGELLEFGIINIDKPRGPTSFQVSEFVRKQLGGRKTSHFGTLDPNVTGILPIALNRACKLSGYFLGENKTYIGIMQLHKDVEIEKIKMIIEKKFLGKIIQIPPVKSRVKRAERERTIYSFELLEKENRDILFKVKCEGGTYVRKLLTDLGDEIEVGAHMLELRRTDAGIFSEPAVSLYDFEKAVEEWKNGNEKLLREMIIPGEIISELYPVVEIQKESIGKILHGSPIHEDELIGDSEKFRVGDKLIVFSEEKFVGVFRVIKEGNLFARSEFSLQPIK